uniref:RBR-type E3 ubiquitin transferase n=1 Tax=Aegilops tauschii subsp. strangulata TaxID=200361 RepID=A0A453B599_AEGTS
MPSAVPSAALLLLVVLSAEGQPFKGLVPKNGSVVLVGSNVTATAGAAAMCYQTSAVEEKAKQNKAALDVAPLAVCLDDDLLLPGELLLNGAGSVPSARQSAPTPGASPADADKKGLSGRAKAWCFWALAVAATAVVFVVRPETFLVSRIGPISTDDDVPVVDGDGELFDCAICMETVPGVRKFSVSSCGHAFCSGCVVRYVAAKLGENVPRVKCPDPGCEEGAVEPESCFGVISSDLLDKWGFLLCESALGAKRVYCPYRECSAPLLADAEAGAAAIAEAECPHCHRLFCARCAAPWHADVGCREFQELGQDERGREDLLLRRLAGRQRWQRCPKCKMYVEKSEGCNYIKCRCGCSFCYRCASKVSAQTHYCGMCKR